MGKKKIVLDTNILISAIGWQGKSRQIFNKVTSGELILVISYEQFIEFARVLNYPKFGFTKIEKDKIRP
ncbi:MAG: PIN domain-containing protein [Candidatus Micrarchaeales archaeon]